MEAIELGIGSRIIHPEFGNGVVIQVKPESYQITFTDYGIKEIARTFVDFEVVECVENREDLVSIADIEKRLIKIFTRYADIQETVPMGDKWRGGMLIMRPADKTKPTKEMLIDTFFHKIVMVRDRLRVMEQKINNSKLDENLKIDLQLYITRIYGSLTSFNVLFKDKDHNFIGAKSS